jgi:hypothetical protein
MHALGVDYGQGFYLGRPGTDLHPGYPHGNWLTVPEPAWNLKADPLEPWLQWSNQDQAQWDTCLPSLERISQKFLEIVAQQPLLASTSNVAWPHTLHDHLMQMAKDFSDTFLMDPRDPQVRKRMRQRSSEHARAGVSPASYIILAHHYFGAYHTLEQSNDSILPSLTLFRQRWLWSVADGLNTYAATLPLADTWEYNA